MRIITETSELQHLCERLAHTSYIAVDTEFLRERTYYPKLCLVQVAGPDVAVAIDPLAENINLAPLYALLGDPNVLKVFHACKQDVEIFFQLTGHVPAPLFDTQVAAMVCGHGEAASYETLTTQLLKQPIDKSMRFTDWARRPLSEKQVEYAISDVLYLRPVYEALVKEITASGRDEWIAEEMADLAKAENYVVNPDEAWRKLRHRSKSPKYLAMLKAVAKWRELEAQRSNVPRGRIIKDETLLEIAATAPATAQELQQVRGLGNHLGHERMHALLQIIEETKAMPSSQYPRLPTYKPMPEGSDGAFDLLRVLLKLRCEEAGVAPSLVANKDDIEDFVRADKNSHLLHGWRYELFGRQAQALLAGKLAFSLDANTGHIIFNESKEPGYE